MLIFIIILGVSNLLAFAVLALNSEQHLADETPRASKTTPDTPCCSCKQSRPIVDTFLSLSGGNQQLF